MMNIHTLQTPGVDAAEPPRLVFGRFGEDMNLLAERYSKESEWAGPVAVIFTCEPPRASLCTNRSLDRCLHEAMASVLDMRKRGNPKWQAIHSGWAHACGHFNIGALEIERAKVASVS